jgi:predicted ArsR family transcriptional regulator
MAVSLPCGVSRVDCDTPKLPPPALRLLVELRKRATEVIDGAVVATRSELAEVLGVSDRTIRRARADLTAVGLLEVEGPDTRYVGNTYRLSI